MKKFLAAILVALCGILTTDANNVNTISDVERHMIENNNFNTNFSDYKVNMTLMIGTKKINYDVIYRYESGDLTYLVGKSNDAQVGIIAVDHQYNNVKILTRDNKSFCFPVRMNYALIKDLRDLPEISTL